MLQDTPILIVDDERAIVDMLVTVLQKEGYKTIDVAYNAEAALEACTKRKYSLVLLDIMMPGQSGVEICPFIRKTTNGPIIFLTAKSSDLDQLTGFAVGADDYIMKPFNPLVVVARIAAHLRRYIAQQEQTHSIPSILPHTRYDFGSFIVDEQNVTLTVKGEEIHTPALVFQLLLFLCKHPNRVFSKSELYERVWGGHMLNDDNTVMVHIHRIRERIEEDSTKPKLLVNVRGMGYKLVFTKGDE